MSGVETWSDRTPGTLRVMVNNDGVPVVWRIVRTEATDVGYRVVGEELREATKADLEAWENRS